jgi:hypothetical protein
MKFGLGIQKLMWYREEFTDIQTHIQHGDGISVLLFLQNKENRPKLVAKTTENNIQIRRQKSMPRYRDRAPLSAGICSFL